LPQPGLQIVQKRSRLLLSYASARVWSLSANVCFNGIQLANPTQCFGRRWRGLAYVQIMDLAPGMGHTGSFLYPAIGVDLVIAGKGVGL
jgi:hypothetical protein